MIAAIYSRKSSDQSGIPDAEKSFARQIEHARAYAATKGWIVANEYVYTDDGISGAEFAARPGFLRLMNALKPRPAFNVLIMSEESRLGREAIETAYVLKQIVAAGVRAAAHDQMAHHRRRYAAKPYRPVFVGREPKVPALRIPAVCGLRRRAGWKRAAVLMCGERRVFYGCSAHSRHGRSVCPNALTVPMDVADAVVLTVVESNLLNPRVLEAAVRRAAKRLSRAGSLSPSSVQQDLAAVERELGNLAAPVAAGGDVPALVAALRDREAHRRLLLDRLRAASLPTSSPTDILAELQERLTDWRSLLATKRRKRASS